MNMFQTEPGRGDRRQLKYSTLDMVNLNMC